MRQIEDIKTKKKYKQFNEKERFKLEALLEMKVKVLEISKKLGKNKSTIYREINRGKTKRLTSELKEIEVYRADVSQRRYNEEVYIVQKSVITSATIPKVFPPDKGD